MDLSASARSSSSVSSRRRSKHTSRRRQSTSVSAPAALTLQAVANKQREAPAYRNSSTTIISLPPEALTHNPLIRREKPARSSRRLDTARGRYNWSSSRRRHAHPSSSGSSASSSSSRSSSFSPLPSPGRKSSSSSSKSERSTNDSSETLEKRTRKVLSSTSSSQSSFFRSSKDSGQPRRHTSGSRRDQSHPQDSAKSGSLLLSSCDTSTSTRKSQKKRKRRRPISGSRSPESCKKKCRERSRSVPDGDRRKNSTQGSLSRKYGFPHINSDPTCLNDSFNISSGHSQYFLEHGQHGISMDGSEQRKAGSPKRNVSSSPGFTNVVFVTDVPVRLPTQKHCRASRKDTDHYKERPWLKSPDVQDLSRGQSKDSHLGTGSNNFGEPCNRGSCSTPRGRRKESSMEKRQSEHLARRGVAYGHDLSVLNNQDFSFCSYDSPKSSSHIGLNRSGCGSSNGRSPHTPKSQRYSSGTGSSVTDESWAVEFITRSRSYRHTFIDTHCHLDLLYGRMGVPSTTPYSQFVSDHALSYPANYEGCVAVFCNPRTFDLHAPQDQILTTVAEEYGVWLAVGCHPKSATEFTSSCERGLRKLLTHPKVVALGEIGLDYSGKFGMHADVQKQVLVTQLRLAIELDHPMVVHCRDADDDCLAIMLKHVPREYKIHLHCFTSDPDTAWRWLEAFPNLLLGFTPVITYRSAWEPALVASTIPLHRLLLETDAPYFLPGHVRSTTLKLSHPGFALFTAEKVAELRGIPVDEVLKACRENTQRMYGI